MLTEEMKIILGALMVAFHEGRCHQFSNKSNTGYSYCLHLLPKVMEDLEANQAELEKLSDYYDDDDDDDQGRIDCTRDSLD